VSKSKELGRTFLPAGALSGAEQSRLLAYDTLGEDPSEKNCTLALTASRTLPEQCLGGSPLPSSSSVMAAMPSAKSPQISTTGARDGTRALACGSMITTRPSLVLLALKVTTGTSGDGDGEKWQFDR
jgi:hypothetical protein